VAMTIYSSFTTKLAPGELILPKKHPYI